MAKCFANINAILVKYKHPNLAVICHNIISQYNQDNPIYNEYRWYISQYSFAIWVLVKVAYFYTRLTSRGHRPRGTALRVGLSNGITDIGLLKRLEIIYVIFKNFAFTCITCIMKILTSDVFDIQIYYHFFSHPKRFFYSVTPYL